MKEGWEAYIHVNGCILIKKYVENFIEIDRSSPFVKQYLGILLDTKEKHYTREEAEEYFQNEYEKWTKSNGL